MPEHYLGAIEYRTDGPETLRRIICGCGQECDWSDIWEPAIESYADHRVTVVVEHVQKRLVEDNA